MLKLTYTETDFYLEYLAQSLEDWVQARVILALRIGQSLCVEPSTASFLLPVYLLGVDVLKKSEISSEREIMTICVCDSEYIEVTLQGSWISSGCNDANGVFVTKMSDRTEFFLHKLWQEAQICQEVRS
ncbi:alr0857 family protein [Brunnivagina elsteri]|uniref:Uncharacterized protein n=1 Tax=Brunnivagina elsteri CCALA 953 TaxID=987040 RepID=A0A2A2TJ44_9CYAN|nr:alr0857 family protein [Calothrix elsteri]PAX54142.1 hypothetical protein CK510_12705 [Calothrix elsteri CCALA 953]